MDVAEVKVSSAAAVGLFGDEYLPGDELAAAPAALTAAAAGGGGYACALDGGQQRLVGGGSDIELLAVLDDLEIEGLAADLLGISGLIPGILDGTEHFTSDKLPAQTELCDLTVEEVVHGLRAAHEDAVLAVAAVLFDELSGDKAVLVAFLFLVGKDMYNMYLIAGSTDLVQLLLVDDALCGTGAKEYCQIKVLMTVAYCVCHAHKGSYTGSAGKSNDFLRVAQSLIVEMTLRAGDRNFLTDLPIILNIGRHEACIVALYGYKDNYTVTYRPFRSAD